MHLFQYTKFDDALHQACLAPLLQQQASSNQMFAVPKSALPLMVVIEDAVWGEPEQLQVFVQKAEVHRAV